MNRQIIQQHNIVGLHLWHKQLVNAGVKNGSVNGSLHAQRGDDTLQPHRTNNRQIQATVAWNRLHRSFTFFSAPVKSGQRQMKAGFINKNKSLSLELSNFLAE